MSGKRKAAACEESPPTRFFFFFFSPQTQLVALGCQCRGDGRWVHIACAMQVRAGRACCLACAGESLLSFCLTRETPTFSPPLSKWYGVHGRECEICKANVAQLFWPPEGAGGGPFPHNQAGGALVAAGGGRGPGARPVPCCCGHRSSFFGCMLIMGMLGMALVMLIMVSESGLRPWRGEGGGSERK